MHKSGGLDELLLDERDFGTNLQIARVSADDLEAQNRHLLEALNSGTVSPKAAGETLSAAQKLLAESCNDAVSVNAVGESADGGGIVVSESIFPTLLDLNVMESSFIGNCAYYSLEIGGNISVVASTPVNYPSSFPGGFLYRTTASTSPQLMMYTGCFHVDSLTVRIYAHTRGLGDVALAIVDLIGKALEKAAQRYSE